MEKINDEDSGFGIRYRSVDSQKSEILNGCGSGRLTTARGPDY
jgi:hypothetical protein